MTAHGTPSLEGDATYAYSGLSRHAYLTNKHNHLKKLEAELPKIITENRNVYKFLWMLTSGRHMLTPHGPLLWNVMLPTSVLV